MMHRRLCPRVASSLDPDTITQRLQTLAPHPTPPRLEAVAEEVQALPSYPAIPDVGLVGIELKRVLLNPGLHFAAVLPVLRWRYV